MYLSRLVLNPRSRAVRHDLADCHELHRTIMSAFPDLDGSEEVRARLTVLYRVDSSKQELIVLVQSEAYPDWSRLDSPDAREAYLTEHKTGEVKELWDGLRAGQVLRFRLAANPTRRVHADHAASDRLAGKRVGLYQEADQIEWLKRQGERSGFQVFGVRVRDRNGESMPAIADVAVMPRPRVTGRRRAGGNGGPRRQLTFHAVTYEGLLRVADPDAFRQALKQGIGSGKAYGFGLLSIARGR